MANTHTIVHYRADLEPTAADRERTFLSGIGVWLTIAVLAVAILFAGFFVLHRSHTEALVPGQPQAVSPLPAGSH